MADVTFRVDDENLNSFLSQMRDMADYCIAHHEEMADWLCETQDVELGIEARKAMRIMLRRFRSILDDPEYRRHHHVHDVRAYPSPFSDIPPGVRRLAQEIIRDLAEDSATVEGMLREILTGIKPTEKGKVNKVDLSDEKE